MHELVDIIEQATSSNDAIKNTSMQLFKDNIKTNIIHLNIYKKNPQEFTELLQFIYDYQPLEFSKVDFQKRKHNSKKFQES